MLQRIEQPEAIKTKRAVKFTALGGKRGIRTPGTVARTPHFECGPIDHSGIFPMRFAGANVRIYFLIPTIYTDILHFFCSYVNFGMVSTDKCAIFVHTKLGFSFVLYKKEGRL